jgi:hypothetical protein
LNDTDEYRQKIDRIVLVLSDLAQAQREFPSAAKLAEQLIPDDEQNIRVLNALRGAKLAHLSVTDFRQALKAWTTEWNKTMKTLAKEQAALEAREDVARQLGGMPSDERQYVKLFMSMRNYDMSFDRRFSDGTGRTLNYEDIQNDMQLTAATLRLTKPRGDMLGTGNLDRALNEWTTLRREDRRLSILERIMALPKGVTQEEVDTTFSAICEAYFEDPKFGEAAVRNFIWQVKRKLLGKYIEQHRMLVLLGAQNTAKSWVGRKLQAPIAEIAAEVSLRDVLDERQMDMPQMFSLFIDEMTFADRADASAMKSLITAADCSRRPMGTNRAQKIIVNSTLQGNSNRSLGSLIYDSSGMRRFVEVQVRPRAEIEPYWPLIEGFDWQSLWQAQDAFAADPLAPFATMLRELQEQMRNPSSVETWLTMFDPSFDAELRKRDTSSHEKAEYFAADLYLIFRRWESDYDPKHITNLNRWGRELKSLIANKAPAADGWGVRQAGNKIVYGLRLKTNDTRGPGLVLVRR